MSVRVDRLSGGPADVPACVDISLRRIFVCVSASLLGARIATHASPDGREESKGAPPRARAILVLFFFFPFFRFSGAPQAPRHERVLI